MAFLITRPWLLLLLLALAWLLLSLEADDEDAAEAALELAALALDSLVVLAAALVFLALLLALRLWLLEWELVALALLVAVDFWLDWWLPQPVRPAPSRTTAVIISAFFNFKLLLKLETWAPAPQREPRLVSAPGRQKATVRPKKFAARATMEKTLERKRSRCPKPPHPNH